MVGAEVSHVENGTDASVVQEVQDMVILSTCHNTK